MEDNKDTQNKHIPKVSIGMPVYNGERFIRKALDSLLAQTFTDFELIISDNASTDRTQKICKEYKVRDKRIRYVRQNKNNGAIANFQFVLDESVGNYFMWAAVDDRRDREFLRLSLMVFENDNDCGLVFCDYRVLNLETGSPSSAYVGMFNSDKPSKQYFMRLLAPCPSLIYGLHRLSTLRQLPPLQAYDFFDVHMTHWYAVHSVVKIIPLPLYTAGVKGLLTPDGKRIPYSVTCTKIDPTCFLREEKQMLFQQFSFFVAMPLYCILWYCYFKNTRKVNKIIESTKVELKKKVGNFQ